MLLKKIYFSYGGYFFQQSGTICAILAKRIGEKISEQK